jgi:glucarate dehydratase
MNGKGTPIITDMKVIPVAGFDSPTLTLSGCHAPMFTRNIVILTDNSGNTGIGETHGGEDIRKALESYKPLVIGRQIGDYKNVVNDLVHGGWRAANDDGEGLQGLNLANLKFVVHAEGAVETAMMDLLGKFMDLPLCALLGDGQQRDKIVILGYMFYIYGKNKMPGLNYIDESDSSDPWYKVRRNEALTPEAIVEQAQALNERYGFKHFKLKGGVLEGSKEMETVCAVKKAFPDARVNIDPNGAWSLDEAISLCNKMHGILTYAEDPCGPEKGFSSREIMAEFKNATGFQVATNMIATNWRQFYHSVIEHSVDIVLADPHFWTMNGSVRIGQCLNDWGLTWGSHSNNHFDLSLATFVQTAAAVPGNITALDTHWIWQDGQSLSKEPLQIKDGCIEVPKTPGLGIEIDMNKVMKANALYEKMDSHDRDDAIAMQHIFNGNWVYDSKKPCLVR